MFLKYDLYDQWTKESGETLGPFSFSTSTPNQLNVSASVGTAMMQKIINIYCRLVLFLHNNYFLPVVMTS